MAQIAQLYATLDDAIQSLAEVWIVPNDRLLLNSSLLKPLASNQLYRVGISAVQSWVPRRVRTIGIKQLEPLPMYPTALADPHWAHATATDWRELMQLTQQVGAGYSSSTISERISGAITQQMAALRLDRRVLEIDWLDEDLNQRRLPSLLFSAYLNRWHGYIHHTLVAIEVPRFDLQLS